MLLRSVRLQSAHTEPGHILIDVEISYLWISRFVMRIMNQNTTARSGARQRRMYTIDCRSNECIVFGSEGFNSHLPIVTRPFRTPVPKLNLKVEQYI